MPSSIANFFHVQRINKANLVKRDASSIERSKLQSRVLKKSSPARNVKRKTPQLTTSSTKVTQEDKLHKIKSNRATRAHLASGKVSLIQQKLPAYVRFAHLSMQTFPAEHSSPGCPLATDVAVECPITGTKSTTGVKELGHVPEQLIIYTSAHNANSSTRFQEVGVVTTPELDALEKDAKEAPVKEIRDLTKSDSCPNTPVKGTIVSVTKDAAKVERVVPEVEPISHIPSALHLPGHMQRLLELFRTCEGIISTLHNRSEVCSFDKIKPAVQEVVRGEFTEKSVGQFSAVYPSAYSFRYDKQLDKITKLPLSTYTLILVPNLRTDGTQMANDSPTKGHLVFTGTRLIQRRRIFHRALLMRVKKAHREFLIERFSLSESDLPEDSALRRWHPAFTLNILVPEVEPAPLPPRPDGYDTDKITSAREAVAAFRSRALFREAKACQKLIPTAPAAEIKLAPPPLPPVSKAPASALKGVSTALLAKVRERERQMLNVGICGRAGNLTQLTRDPETASERAANAALPATITQVWRELRSNSGRPVPLALVAARLSQSSSSGLSPEEALKRVEHLLALMPDWLERVAWARPHLRFKDGADRSLKSVIDEAKAKVAKNGFI